MLFTLFEANLPKKKETRVEPLQEIDINGDIKGRPRIISYHSLTRNSKKNLLHAIEEAIRENEDIFVGFFNLISDPDPRKRLVLPIVRPPAKMPEVLDLLPYIDSRSKKLLKEERPFRNFDDLRKIGINPVKVVSLRVLAELTGSKYQMFIVPKDVIPKLLS